MPKTSVLIYLTLIVIATITTKVIHGNQSDDEEYVDSVINSLLNGDSIEVTADIGDTGEVQQPFYEDGVWKCGNCDVIDEKTLIYTEVYNVETNYLEYVPYEIQVGLSVEGMQCVTVTADTPSPSRVFTRVVHGSCTGPSVTLAVELAHEFTARVYGRN